MENNFYDKVHEVTYALKERGEYLRYMELKAKIQEDEVLTQTVKDFKVEQMELQREMMMTGSLNEKKKEELQTKYEGLINNKEVKEYFEMEIRLDILLADMQKIIADGLKELYDI